jgi:hypothetical protein
VRFCVMQVAASNVVTVASAGGSIFGGDTTLGTQFQSGCWISSGTDYFGQDGAW